MERGVDLLQRVQFFLHDTLDGQTKTVIGFTNNQLFADIGFSFTPMAVWGDF